jgi:hypothetical protein
MTDASKKMVSLLSLKQVPPMMNWEDIKVGEWYHLPPLIFNKRMDFRVVRKEANIIKIVKLGDDYQQTMFRTDITTRFIVKKIELHGTET